MGKRFESNFLGIFLILLGAAFLILRGLFGVNTDVSAWWGVIPIVIGWLVLTVVQLIPQGAGKKPNTTPDLSQRRDEEKPKKYIR